MSARDDYPALIHSLGAAVDLNLDMTRWRAQFKRELNAALDEIDSLRAALQLSQDARRTGR